MCGRQLWKWGVVLLAICAGTAPAGAETPALDDASFYLRGFGTLGVSRASSADGGYVRDLSQPRGVRGGEWSGRIDNVIGLQANWRASPQTELVGQVVSRYRYDQSRDPEVMWAFARWSPDARADVRLGRIGADFMMAADSRLVGYSYLPANPSHDFFGPLFFSHFDGIDGALSLPVGADVLRGKLFAGATREKTSGTPGIWDTSGSRVAGWVVDYTAGAWQWRANTARIRFSSDINFAPLPDLLRAAGDATGIATAQQAADALTTKGTTSRFYSLGATYDEGPLQVQAMLNRIEHESGTFQNSRAGYLLAGYRVGHWIPYAGLSRWTSRYKDYSTGLPDVAPFAALNSNFALLMRASGVDQKTYTAGLRWDVMPQVALKLQWDAIHGNERSRFPFTNTDPEWNGRTDVVTGVIDFVF